MLYNFCFRVFWGMVNFQSKEKGAQLVKGKRGRLIFTTKRRRKVWTRVFWAAGYYTSSQTQPAKSQTPTRTKASCPIEQRSSTVILDDL